MSFPAACILLSSSLPRHQQGIAGSLVSTFVNYSISIGLGFAGTVEYYTTKNKEPNLSTSIFGMRNAFRMGWVWLVWCCAFFHIYVAPNHQQKKADTVTRCIKQPDIKRIFKHLICNLIK